MFSAYLIMAAQIMAAVPSGKDCGFQENKATIERTRAMILRESPLGSLVGEMPTPSGTHECARVVFSIDGDGHPVDVHIVESTGNFSVNMGVVASIKKCVMKREIFSRFRTYMLVFQVDDNKMPPNYLKSH